MSNIEPSPTDEQELIDPLRLEHQLCFRLYAAAHAMNRAYRFTLGPLGLTYPQYLTMLALWEQDRQSVSELGLRLRLDSGTLTPVLKRLEAAGLVTRARSRADEREVEISLTEQGSSLRIDALNVQRDIRCRLGMSDEKIRDLQADLDEVLAHLDDAAACVTVGAGA